MDFDRNKSAPTNHDKAPSFQPITPRSQPYGKDHRMTDNSVSERERIATKSLETLSVIPVETSFPNDPKPADQLHHIISEPTPQLRWARKFDRMPTTAAAIGPLTAGGMLTAILLSPIEIAGSADIWRDFMQVLPVDVSLTTGNAVIGAVGGAGASVVAGPNLDLWTPSLRTDGKIGTMIATDGDGQLQTEIRTTGEKKAVAREINAASNRHYQYRARTTTLARLLGIKPARIASDDIVGGEVTFSVSGSYDALLRGKTTADILSNGDEALPLNQIGQHLVKADSPTVIQTVCQARLPQAYRIDRIIDGIRRQESDLPVHRHLRQLRHDPATYRDPSDLPEKDQKRIEKLRQTRGGTLYDVNIRGLALVENETERREAKRTLSRVSETVQAVTNEYIDTDIEWFEHEDRWLGEDPEETILRRVSESVVDATPPFTAGMRRNTVRSNLVVDADELWSLILLPGDGSPEVRDNHETLPPSQQQTQQPGNDLKDLFTHTDDLWDLDPDDPSSESTAHAGDE